MRKTLTVLVFSLLVLSIAHEAAAQEAVAQELKVVLLGDTGAGSNFASVLALADSERADVIMINGDLGYDASPTAWRKKVEAAIDINAHPVIGSLGNHDVDAGPEKYVAIFSGFRNSVNGLKSRCTGTTGISQGHDIAAVDEVCTFGNVSIVSSAIGQVLTKNYLEQRLEDKLKKIPSQNWKLVGYHFTLSPMNPGIKPDESTYKFFDLIRQYGAIGAQAHTHSAMASCPIVSVFAKNVPIKCSPEFGRNLEDRFVQAGTGLYVDSSLGGASVRNRTRCTKASERGCEHLVDLITEEGYTRVDGTTKTNFDRNGALFITFNVGGDPTAALAYFKSTDGQEIFRFTISR